MAGDKGGKSRKALGRGLSALISSSVAQPQAGSQPGTGAPVQSGGAKSGGNVIPIREESSGKDGVSSVPVKDVAPNPNQPRQHFDQGELKELSDSIVEHGILQPILVSPFPSEEEQVAKYMIVAGERRWRAAQLAELAEVPIIVRDFDTKQILEVALVENIQRSNLTPIEEARSYQILQDDFSMTQEQLASRVGKSRAAVANSLRLLKLPTDVQELVDGERLSVGHAKVILSVKEPGVQRNLAKQSISEQLTVRGLEEIVGRNVTIRKGKKTKGAATRKGGKASSFPEVEDSLRKAMGTKVRIKHSSSGRGKIEIDYYSEEELDRLVEALTS